jgi:hypothetical protein
LPHCTPNRDEEGIHPFADSFAERRLGGYGCVLQAVAFEPAGCDQNVVDQVGWRLHLLKRLQPVLTGFDLGEHGSAARARAGMGVEAVLFRVGQLLIESVKKERFELLALHTVVGFTWHHITCL